MRYNGVIEEKLRVIEGKLSDIDDWKIQSFETLKQSSMLQNATERALQVIIEAAVDICERILAVEGTPAPETSADSIRAVISLGIISNNPDYFEMIRFRNFIVHRYEKIDLEIIYAIIKNKLSVFRNFIHEIRNS
jgi:uncharacterized protein YutE (UPF0331/DUF86 family)